MIVYWDGYGLVDEASGVFQHALHLVHELARIGVSPRLVTSPAGADHFPSLPKHLLPDPAIFARLANSKLIWPRRVRRLVNQAIEGASEPAILHGLSNVNLASFSRRHERLRTVLTVHDLIPLLAPDGVSSAYRWQFSWALPRAVAAADRVVCVSDWTRRCLAELIPGCAAKLVVIPNGRPQRTGSASELTPAKNGQRRPRLLMVARGEGYKRLDFFLELVRIFGRNGEADLVTDARGLEAARRYFERYPMLAERVRVHPPCDRADLDRLYAMADVYVHTSLFEGYGLPAVEALIQGTPVVYLAGSGLDEAVGGAASIAVARQDLDEHGAWTAAIERAVELGEKRDFFDLSQAEVNSRPSWGDAARALESLYTDLIATCAHP